MAKAADEWIHERTKNQLILARASLMRVDKVEKELSSDSSMKEDLHTAIMKATSAWWECMQPVLMAMDYMQNFTRETWLQIVKTECK